MAFGLFLFVTFTARVSGGPKTPWEPPRRPKRPPKSIQDGPKKTRKKEQQARLECFRLKGLWLHEILQLALYRSLAARLVFHPLLLTKRTNETSDPMCPMGPMWELFNIEIVAHPLVPIPILEWTLCSSWRFLNERYVSFVLLVCPCLFCACVLAKHAYQKLQKLWTIYGFYVRIMKLCRISVSFVNIS